MKSVLWIALTVAAYLVGLAVRKALGRHPVANPVLLAMTIVIIVLAATGTSFTEYFVANAPITFLLGPATVALGVPLAANFVHLRRSLRAVLLAVLAGSVTAMLAGFLLVSVLGGSTLVGRSMLPKAVTTPIAMAVAQQIGGQPSLSAAFAILGGIIAAMSLRAVLKLARVHHPHAIGLAAGTAGSGIAAAYVAALGDGQAAFAAIGIGLNGLATSLLAPVIAGLFRM